MSPAHAMFVERIRGFPLGRNRRRRRSAVRTLLASFVVCCVASLVVRLTAPAAASGSGSLAGDSPPQTVSFGPGEKCEYKVSAGVLGGVGKGTMEIAGIESIHNRPAYHMILSIKGGVPFARVDTKLQSWVDVARFVSLRFEQNQKEVRFKRHRVIDFFPEERRWVRIDGEGRGDLPTDAPLDDVSFLYYARTIPLEVGQTYTFYRYFKESGNPVILKVLRREKVRVPLGEFDTIVVQPIIRAGGLFGEGGEAEVYLTDDPRRLLVQMRSKVPVLGYLNLELTSYQRGAAPVRPAWTQPQNSTER